MQQRRPRLGDILDDYCPRERRITNHAVVAMIEDEVRQTRCTTCDAEHEYKQAKVPASRRRKPGELPPGDVAEPAAASMRVTSSSPAARDLEPAPPTAFGDDTETDVPSHFDTSLDEPAQDDVHDGALQADALEDVASSEDDGPVHRRLIRATLPRPEGQAPERKAPDFTVRQPGSGGRTDQRNGNGPRRRGRQQGRQGGGTSQGHPMRSGNARHGSGRPGAESHMHDQRNGNRAGNVAGQRGGRPSGPPRGPRPAGQGRKRGR